VIRLPVSGAGVLLRLPDGADEIALNEGDPTAIPAALRLLNRIVEPADQSIADQQAPDQEIGNWSSLTVTDFEILLLRVREMVIGGTVSSDVACPTCRERVEISFRIGDYIAAIRPNTPRGVARGSRDGWLVLDGAEWRLPLVADLLVVRDAPAPGPALRALCQAPGTPPRMRSRIERAISRMAPEVTGHVGGACPSCGATLEALFDVTTFVVAELRRVAAGVYAEVHALAAAYGWSEAAILALPGARRRRYAELVRGSVDAGSTLGARFSAVA
jgi:hypothetical protein